MKISINKTKITPTESVTLSGYNRSEKSKGVLDDVFAITLIMQIDKTFMVFTSIDAINIDLVFADAYRKRVADLLKCPVSQVHLSATHTHSAPAFFDLPTLTSAREPGLAEKLSLTLDKLITKGLNELIEVETEFRSIDIEGVFSNRNQPDGPADKSYQELLFINEGAIVGVLGNLATHPTVLHQDNLLISSDLIGSTRSKLESHYHCPIILLNGACGDVSTRFNRTDDQYHDLSKLSDALFKQIILAEASHTFKPSSVLSKDNKFETSLNAQTDEWTQSEIKRLENSTQDATLYNRLIAKQSVGIFDVVVNFSLIKVDNYLFITIPGELNSALGLRLRSYFANYIVFLFAYTDNYTSYLIEKKDHGLFFESYIAITPYDTGNKLIDKIVELETCL